MAKQTLLRAATLLSESGENAAILRANVTSPGGTTAAGLRVLENHGVRGAFIDAINAATQRAYELSSLQSEHRAVFVCGYRTRI
jgi:pyrroline-5-carboxylate reductase